MHILQIFFKALSLTSLPSILDSLNATIFVPCDAAFAEIPDTIFSDQAATDVNLLESWLKSFIIPDKFKLKKLLNISSTPPEDLNGKPIVIKAGRGGDTSFNGAKTIVSDIRCGNGFIHLVEEFLIPK